MLKISLKLYIFITILISVFINIYIIFEYSTQIDAPYSRLEKTVVRNPADRFLTNLSAIQYIIINIFQYFKIIFSDLLFYILTVIIDILLIHFIKKNIDRVQTIVSNPTSNAKISNDYFEWNKFLNI